MDTVTVVDTSTGEVRVFEKAELLVALNGTIFVKSGKKTVFASSAPHLVAEYRK
ncbi:MAG: hypothetical protein [Caudoviricetes sp.]|nr:MAG: hypothetical protein [Caudoviricetes sp.]